MKTVTLGVLLTAAAVALAPAAGAEMQIGNYEVQTPRDPGHMWIWEIRPCTSPSPGCLHVQAVPRPNGQAAPWDGNAQLANGRYTMVVDVPDGLRCTLVNFLPSHDTYSWDAVTLAGAVDSTSDAGCGGGGGTVTYPFTLVRY
ncbi:MAG: hypothetical protein ACRDRT_18035 [Pseudonocardiaceae bacterium]